MLQDEITVSAILREHSSLLDNYSYGEDTLHDLIHIASVITSACLALNIECPIVVGGLAVETYTIGDYTTRDVDFISDFMTDIHKVMLGLGFFAKEGYRYYCHPKFGDVIEFPTPPLNGSKDRIAVVDLPNGGQYYVIGLEDIIINRVEEFVHWDKKDLRRESAQQVITILNAHSESIDYAYLNEQASLKGIADGLQLLIAEAQ